MRACEKFITSIEIDSSYFLLILLKFKIKFNRIVLLSSREFQIKNFIFQMKKSLEYFEIKIDTIDKQFQIM